MQMKAWWALIGARPATFLLRDPGQVFKPSQSRGLRRDVNEIIDTE